MYTLPETVLLLQCLKMEEVMLDYCRQLATQGQVMMFRYTNVDGSKNNTVLQSCVEIQQVMNY